MTSVTNKTIVDLQNRIIQLEALWLEPTKEMLQAGIAEVHSVLETTADDLFNSGDCSHINHIDLDTLTDSQASDIAVFVLQAMAGKLPKA